MCDRSLATALQGRQDGGVDLDPAHLRSFMAIVDYGGYHRAAEALHLTQPAVSRHMRRLERASSARPCSPSAGAASS